MTEREEIETCGYLHVHEETVQRVQQELADEAYRRLTPDLQAIYDRWQEWLQGAKR